MFVVQALHVCEPTRDVLLRHLLDLRIPEFGRFIFLACASELTVASCPPIIPRMRRQLVGLALAVATGCGGPSARLKSPSLPSSAAWGAEPSADPFVEASLKGLALSEARGMSLDDRGEFLAFFRAPTFRLVLRTAAKDCKSVNTEPKAGAVVVAAGTYVQVEARNTSDRPLFPVLVEYSEQGFTVANADLDRIAPGDRWTACVTTTAGDSVVRVVGMPRDVYSSGLRSALDEETFEAEPNQELYRAMRTVLRTDARQRFLLARLRVANKAPLAADSVLLRVFRGKGVAPTQVDLTSRLPVQTGLLVYGEQRGRMTVALYERGRPPVVAAMAATPVDVDRQVEDLARAIAGPNVAARAPSLRNFAVVEEPSSPAGAGGGAKVNGVSAAEILFPRDVRDRIEELKHIVVVPVRSLGRLPWNALALNGRPLVASHTVTVIPDLTALIDVPVWSPKFERPLIVGDPLLRQEDYPEWHLPTLPGARAEASSVAEALGAKPLLGPGATRTEVVARAPDADLIYLATHGFADEKSPLMGSFIALNEGRWTAADVMAVRLKAKLAVLSACQTGLGKDVGGGTIGLARSFYKAGVPRIVMSLWNVNDGGTKALMRRFVGHLNNGVSPAEALRRASDELRKSKVPASVWASFTLFGSADRQP